MIHDLFSKALPVRILYEFLVSITELHVQPLLTSFVSLLIKWRRFATYLMPLMSKYLSVALHLYAYNLTFFPSVRDHVSQP